MSGTLRTPATNILEGFAFSGPEVALIAITSLVICALATSLAVESAAIFVPAFLIGFPLLIPSFPAITANEAIGLTLIIMFFGQTSTLAGYIYRKQVRFKLAALILVVTIPLAGLGRVLSYYVPEWFLLSVFVAVVFVLAGILYRSHTAMVEYPDGGVETGATSARTALEFDSNDRIAFGSGGLIAGLVGFGIGEVINTRLYTKKNLDIQMSTGTSTLVLFVTLLAANVVNFGILFTGAFGSEGAVSIPMTVAVIIAPVVLVGGQLGAYLNSRLPEQHLIRLLLVVYLGVGLIGLGRIVGGV